MFCAVHQGPLDYVALLHCVLAAAQCIVISPVCVCVCVCEWVNVFVGLITRPREGALRQGENVWLRLTTASTQCLRLSERFFHFVFFCVLSLGCSC